MSLIFQIQYVYFDDQIHQDPSVCEKYLQERHLKSRYSNLKDTQHYNGKFIYKQHSKCGKVDHDQIVTVTLDPGVTAQGVYKYAKYKSQRQPRKTPEVTEIPQVTETLI